MMLKENLPYANICITNKCNFRCFYCQDGGENHCHQKITHMTYTTAKKILDVISGIGVSRIRITGGEPTLNPDFDQIVQYASSLNFSKIRISTNGAFIKNHITVLKDPKIRVQVSLDSLNKDIFHNITDNSDEFENVLDSLSTLSNNHIPTRINMVVLKSNQKEISNMITFCEKMGFSIKLLGLELLDCFDKNRVLNEVITQENYQLILKRIGKKINTIMAPGNLGVSMDEYILNNVTTRVRFFDGWGAKYSRSCKECGIFPCPSGIYGIQILSDGVLSLCRFRRNKCIDCLSLSQDELYSELQNLLEITLNPENNLPQKRKVSYGIDQFIKIP